MNQQQLWQSRRPDLVYDLEKSRLARGVSHIARTKLHRLRKQARRRPHLPKSQKGGKR